MQPAAVADAGGLLVLAGLLEGIDHEVDEVLVLDATSLLVAEYLALRHEGAPHRARAEFGLVSRVSASGSPCEPWRSKQPSRRSVRTTSMHSPHWRWPSRSTFRSSPRTATSPAARSPFSTGTIPRHSRPATSVVQNRFEDRRGAVRRAVGRRTAAAPRRGCGGADTNADDLVGAQQLVELRSPDREHAGRLLR